MSTNITENDEIDLSDIPIISSKIKLIIKINKLNYFHSSLNKLPDKPIIEK